MVKTQSLNPTWYWQTYLLQDVLDLCLGSFLIHEVLLYWQNSTLYWATFWINVSNSSYRSALICLDYRSNMSCYYRSSLTKLQVLYLAETSRVKTRRGISGPKMDLLCEPDVSGNKENFGPPVFCWTCCESLSYISKKMVKTRTRQRKEEVTVTGGPREAI